MRDTYSVREAQAQLARLLREAEEGVPIAITRRDETIAFLISRERLEAIVETLEVLADPEAMAAIRRYEAGESEFADLTALDSDADADPA
jgi:antitoxin YefM